MPYEKLKCLTSEQNKITTNRVSGIRWPVFYTGILMKDVKEVKNPDRI